MTSKKPRKRQAFFISGAAHAYLKERAEAEGRTMIKVFDMICGV